MDTAKSLNDLSKVYLESVYSNKESVDEAAYPGYDEKGNPLKKEPKDERRVVTYADKKANTPAYQKFKAGDKNYKKADHLNNEEFIYRLEESGKFSVEEIQTILEAEVAEGYKPDPVEKRKKKAADLYRRETLAQDTPDKYKTDKTEDPDKLYRRRMAVDSKTKMKKEDVEFVDSLIESGKFSDEEIEKIVEAQVARNNPEKYERDQEKNDTRSKKQKRMDDPNTGINSPAFKKFMQQQGM